MTYPASSIAHEFVKKGIEEGYPVTQMKLQKMVYFAQGVHLALHQEPLVKDVFQAWKYGPVVPGIYHTYKFYGSSPITNTEWVMDQEEMEMAKIDEKAKETVDYTWSLLKETNTVKLSNWTHEDGSPWKLNYIDGANDVIIPNDDIKKYFERFLDK